MLANEGKNKELEFKHFYVPIIVLLLTYLFVKYYVFNPNKILNKFSITIDNKQLWTE